LSFHIRHRQQSQGELILEGCLIGDVRKDLQVGAGPDPTPKAVGVKHELVQQDLPEVDAINEYLTAQELFQFTALEVELMPFSRLDRYYA
jgi:hypothetical protein